MFNYLWSFVTMGIRKLWLKIEAAVRRCSVEKSVLKDFTKFTGKNTCSGVFFKFHLFSRTLEIESQKLFQNPATSH